MFDYKLYEKMVKSPQLKVISKNAREIIFQYKKEYYRIYFEPYPQTDTAKKNPVFIQFAGTKHFSYHYIINVPRGYLNISKITKAIDRYQKYKHLSSLEYTQLINRSPL